MASLSTHVLDASVGGPRAGVTVTVTDASGVVVTTAATGPDGRITDLAGGLAPGRYGICWEAGAGFVTSVAVTVDLDEDRHYHVPLLASPASAVVYLGV